VKFFVSGNGKYSKPLFLSLYFYIFFVFLYWVSAFISFKEKYGFSADKIAAHFFGDPDFPETISFSQLSKNTHMNIAMVGLLLLTLSSMILNTRHSPKLKLTVVTFAFISGTLEVLSDYLVFILGRDFVFLKLVSFSLFQAGLFFALISVIAYLSKKNGNQGDVSNSNLADIIIPIFALIGLGFVLVNFLLFASKIGWTPSQISFYYLGNPARFTRAKTFSGMFEVAYLHFLSMPIYLFSLVHFLFFTRFRWKKTISLLLFTSAFMNNISGFLVRFLMPEFSYVKLLSFWVLELSLLSMILVLLFYSIGAILSGERAFNYDN